MASRGKKKKPVSCLGALLIVCMILIAAATVSVNVLFRSGNAPSLFGRRWCYYTADDMGERVPAGEVVIAENPESIQQQDIVLYRVNTGAARPEYRIAIASLIVETTSNVPDQSASTYYLTTVTNTVAIEVPQQDIVGVCRQRSPQLGVLIGFLTSTLGIVLGLVLPCVILALYLIALIVRTHEARAEQNEDEDTDLAFVQSIQRKQREIAERDAERRAAQERSAASEPEHQPVRLSDEEFARREEEEAARRAERIAAVRSHMEQRRQTETPDGVPLYTTEIITKTHTLTLPRTEKPAPAPREVEPATASFPRLTETGSFTIPTEEQLAQDRREKEEQEARFEAARKLAQAAQEAEFAAIQTEPESAPEPVPAPAPEPEPAAVSPVAVTSASAPAPEPAAATPAKPKPARKQKIASASFGDLMAFLDGEQKKLK